MPFFVPSRDKLIIGLTGTLFAFSSAHGIGTRVCHWAAVAQSPQLKIQVRGAVLPLGEFVHSGSAAVFRSPDGKRIIKIFPAASLGQAKYERHALEFLAEKGYSVAHIRSTPAPVAEMVPELEHFLATKSINCSQGCVVLSRDYVDGESHLETTYEERVKIMHLRDEIRTRFQSGEFRAWLEKRGIDPQKEGIPDAFVDQGDVDMKDFAITPQGPVLLDP